MPATSGPWTRVEEVALRGKYAAINAKGVEHAYPSCRARTLAIAHDELAGGNVIGIACARCARPQHCDEPVLDGHNTPGLRHGANAARLTPAGWRCATCAELEGWQAGPDGWSYL